MSAHRMVYLPVGFAEAADRIVALVERGVLRPQEHWSSREACQAFIDRQPRRLHAAYAPTLAIIRVAEDAEREGYPPCFSASMTERRDGVRVFGEPITESAGAEGMDRCARDALAVGHRALGENHREVRHVA